MALVRSPLWDCEEAGKGNSRARQDGSSPLLRYSSVGVRGERERGGGGIPLVPFSVVKFLLCRASLALKVDPSGFYMAVFKSNIEPK